MTPDQKIPFGLAISSFTASQSASAVQSQGRAWPCYVTKVEGSIVTVKFDILTEDALPEVTIPVFGPEYIRYPIQLGDKGFVVPADVSLRNMSGLGLADTPPDFSNPGNLTALVFLPMGNKNWSAVDGNALVMYGPNGCVIRDTGSGCVITLTPSGVTTVVGSTTIEVVGSKVTMTTPEVIINGKLTVHGLITGDQGFNITGGATTAQVTGNVNIVGTLTNNGKLVGSTHQHSGVTTGSGTTGAPI